MIGQDFYLKEKILQNNLAKKPFASGWYLFMMFMIDYYSRVKKDLNIDYDSFMILQTVASHSVYHLKKKLNIKSYQDIERGLESIYQENSHPKVNNSDKINFGKINKTKLTISSIALVTSLPKETVRRKVNELTKKNILKFSVIKGITVGVNYKKIFNNFVPRSTFEIIKLVKNWEKTGILEDLLKFKI